MNNNLTGARCIVYSIIRRSGGVLSHNQLLQKTVDFGIEDNKC